MDIIKYNSPEYKELIGRSVMVRKRVASTVSKVIDEVRDRGDAALLELTKKFDGVSFKRGKDLSVGEREISASFRDLDAGMILSIKRAIDNVTAFYQHQMPQDFKVKLDNGKILEERYTPVQRAAIYVPAGQVPLVSTVYMCAIPAIVAKVPEIVLLSPPNKEGFINPFILATANMLGIKEVYKVGGAQAIAAAAYGTKTIGKVDKIVGPGNEYVTEAKRQVFGHVGIDMLAGPSEIAIVADKDCNIEYILADLRSQTEHRGGLGIVVIIGDTITKELAKNEIANAFIVPAKDADEAAAIINEFAPEHLELMHADAREFLKKVKNAGAVFVNALTPVPLGDYIAGPSHVLPTATTARFSSGLSCFDFLKRIHVVEYTKKALQEDADAFGRICGIENMPMHKDSVMVRLK